MKRQETSRWSDDRLIAGWQESGLTISCWTRAPSSLSCTVHEAEIVPSRITERRHSGASARIAARLSSHEKTLPNA